MATKPTKNQQKRAKKKAAKEAQKTRDTSEPILQDEPPQQNGDTSKPEAAKPAAPAIEPLIVDPDNPLFDMYKDIMGKFEEADTEDPALKEPEKPEVYFSDDDDIPDEEDEAAQKVSKKKRKQMTKMSVAELKASVKRPEVIEFYDTDAPDPKLLVHIKSYKNVVPVPNHWSLKREYLSSKRGIEKPPFSLPKFIQETGIAEMRDAVLEKQNEASLKQKQRERVQPKMGKLDIDYQKLYEAFFRHQTKPELTRYGEVYYEGKEFETNLKHLRPGEISDELKDALNMPAGAPPPWLINMQRYGPPPSYPSLRVPGVNAPPPPGASWGFGPGQWGKPPVDESTNRPLYGGDIFGVLQQQTTTQQGEPIEKDLWGELQEQEESEEEEEDDEDEEEDEDDEGGMQTSAGLETPSGMSSAMPSEIGGTETVSEFDLRKRRGTETEESSHPRSAYQVIPERQTKVEGFLGGDRAYDLKGTANNVPVLGQDDGRKRKRQGDVDVAIDPENMGREDLQRAYEQQRRAEQNPQWNVGEFQEDLSDMIAAESRKRQKQDQERKGKK
ncbi:Pre-mRNA-splicing factor [Cyphellophora attinorum]|uniref:Pre-mRNA-splicing factor n=1 Tax=Cyphellophora attinorum TaxID=1664694 RepID=A0A0N0NMN5_9EURO|nr:Pre-mRNA-splicing factor [Phialophora attinorum]KPI40558.1 Pre-mRNA-splicing factor [Phialophora attinorum]